MKRTFTQKEIYEYLKDNPLGTEVHIGDLEDMQGKDYIFLDYMNELPILRDNNADYQTVLQISVVVKNFEDRKVLVNYIKKRFLSAPTYSKSDEFDYYVAQFTVYVLLYEQY